MTALYFRMDIDSICDYADRTIWILLLIKLGLFPLLGKLTQFLSTMNPADIINPTNAIKALGIVHQLRCVKFGSKMYVRSQIFIDV